MEAKLLVVDIATTDDGIEFIKDDKEHLYRNWKNELRGRLHAGDNVTIAGEWKQGAKRKYFNIDKILDGSEQPSDKVLPEHQEIIKEARASVSEGKNRSFALSYAKDWCIAKLQSGETIKTLDVLVVAKLFESYLDTGIVVEKKK